MASSKKVILAALAGNTLIASTKFIASAVTGSSSMFSEAIHSVVDSGNQLLLLYALKRGARAPDERYPFGYGKEVYFWSFVVAILIFAVGSGVSILEGVHQLQHPEPVKSIFVNYLVLGFAMVFEGGSLLVAWREFRAVKGDWGYIEAVHRGKDPTMFVVLFEDAAAMAGLLAVLLAQILMQVTGLIVFDAVGSLIVGLVLGATAIWLAYETKGLLIGESANQSVVSSIRAIVSSFEEVKCVNEVLTMHMGPEFILVNLSVEFIRGLQSGRLENIIAAIDDRIKTEQANVKRVFIEAESWRSADGEPGKAAPGSHVRG